MASEIICARWIAPISQPIIHRGAVVFDAGKIRLVGGAAEVIQQFSSSRIHDLSDMLIVPGLINAHTHLELSDCSSDIQHTGRFIDWILSLPQRGGMGPSAVEHSVRGATATGIAESLRFGVACVGDISQYPRYSRGAVSESPLHATSYAEVLGLAKRRPRFEKLLAEVEEQSSGDASIIPGISPHAPYSVDLAGFEQCMKLSRAHHLPLATHLSEWPEEKDFLVSHSGMFREFFDRLGFWSEGVETFAGSPIHFAQSIGLLNHEALLAHVNYCDDEELKLLARGNASVVYCPRTHRYFGHPPHRWREMLDAGINVAAGTDSCASSPDLNVLEEIRLLHRLAPEVSAERLWRLITTNAARAIHQPHAGSLQPGFRADFTAYGVHTDDPLTEILENHSLPQSVWIAGRQVH